MSPMLRHHHRCRPSRSSFYVVDSPNSSQQRGRLGRLTDEERWQLTSIKHHSPLRNLGETPHLAAELRHKKLISTAANDVGSPAQMLYVATRRAWPPSPPAWEGGTGRLCRLLAGIGAGHDCAMTTRRAEQVPRDGAEASKKIMSTSRIG